MSCRNPFQAVGSHAACGDEPCLQEHKKSMHINFITHKSFLTIGNPIPIPLDENGEEGQKDGSAVSKTEAGQEQDPCVVVMERSKVRKCIFKRRGRSNVQNINYIL